MTLPTETGTEAVATVSTGDRCPQCRAPVTASWLACSECGARLAVAAELPAGSPLGGGRFVVRSVLGRGGFGITYAVDDTRLQRRVAVKELFPDVAVRHGLIVLTPPEGREAFASARERFLREARVLARFSHPGIVRVYEVFEEHNTAYLVLELLEGSTLSELLRARGGPFSEAEVLDVAERVGAALGAIHRAGLLHRDVSPSNLVVTDHGRIVLIDFGLARSFDAGRTAAMTRVVTPGYAPPEQYVGSARFGPATDVYGLAATLYRLLTTRTPPSAVERQHGTTVVAPFRLSTGVSKRVSDAVLDGLELNPDHRPQSIDAFLARLGVEAEGPATGIVARSAPASPATTVPAAVPPGASDHTVLEPGRAPRPVRVPGPRAVVPAPIVPRPPVARPPVSRPPVIPDPAAYLPGPVIGPVIGPPPKGRWRVTLPLTAAAVALTSAAPVLLTALLVLVGLPMLATAGDLARHRRRWSAGMAGGGLDRLSPGAAIAPRLVGNVVVSLLRALPALALLAVLIGCWYPVHDAERLVTAADWFLRLSGVAVALVLVVPALRGSDRFASGTAVDHLHARVAPPGARLSQAGWVLWVVCLGLVALGLSFNPEVWPLPG